MFCVVELHVTFTLIANDDDTKAATFEIARCEGPNAAQSTRAKIDGVCGGVWEGGCGRPVDGESENLISEQFRN